MRNLLNIPQTPLILEHKLLQSEPTNEDISLFKETMKLDVTIKEAHWKEACKNMLQKWSIQAQLAKIGRKSGVGS